MDTSKPDDARLSELLAKKDAAYRRWRDLLRDPDCLRNPDKRTAMLNARLVYLDAYADYVFVYRQSQGKRKPDEK